MSKFCPSCGAENADAAVFCAACGGALPAAAQPPAGTPAPPLGPPPTGPPLMASQPVGPPPVGPPPAGFAAPPPPASGGGWKKPLLVVVAVLAALAIAVAIYALATRDDSSGPTASPSPSRSASPSATASASPTVTASPSLTAAPVSTIAAAFGPKADTLGTWDTADNTAVLVSGGGRPLSNLQWSPDGKLIAYQELKKQWGWESKLMICDVASGAAEPVSFGGLAAKVVHGYAWVSETELVASVSTTVPKDSHRNGTLYLCDVAAGAAASLKQSDDSRLEGVDPSVSADGQRIAFVNFEPAGTTSVTESLMLFDRGDRSLKPLASGQIDTMIDGRLFDVPLISPDGSQIFTEQTGSDVGFGVTVYGDDGAKVASIDYLLFPTGAAWDPDRASGFGRLCFGGGKQERGGGSIYIYDQESAGFERLFKVRGKANAGYGPLLHDFTWSPDGEWIAYTIMSPRHDYRTDDLWKVRSDGTMNQRISTDAGWPSWALMVVPQAVPADY